MHCSISAGVCLDYLHCSPLLCSPVIQPVLTSANSVQNKGEFQSEQSMSLNKCKTTWTRSWSLVFWAFGHKVKVATSIIYLLNFFIKEFFYELISSGSIEAGGASSASTIDSFRSFSSTSFDSSIFVFSSSTSFDSSIFVFFSSTSFDSCIFVFSSSTSFDSCIFVFFSSIFE